MLDGHVGVRRLTPTYWAPVGWGKTRAQRAPHPNTSISQYSSQVGRAGLSELRNPTIVVRWKTSLKTLCTYQEQDYEP